MAQRVTQRVTQRDILEKAMLAIEEATGLNTESMRTSLHHAAPEIVPRMWFRLRDFCIAHCSDDDTVAKIYRNALTTWQNHHLP